MTTLTVHIDNEKSEKAILAVLDALGLQYQLEKDTEIPPHVMAGLLKAKDDVAKGRIKEYKGLNAILNR